MPKAVSKSQAAYAMYKQLAQPFDLKYLKYRVGAISPDKKAAVALFYLDAREVTRRLNDVLGVDGWATKESPVVSGGQLFGVKCELSIRMPYKDARGIDVWNTKSDFGEPSRTAPLKGAASDALKRAAVLFGVGRYLYYIPNHYFPLDGKRWADKNAPRRWLADNCQWAVPSAENLERWEDIAMLEYDPKNDVDLDEEGDSIIYTDDESRRILSEAQAKRKEIEAYLRAES